MLATPAASYLETLNPEQRRAVEDGISADGHIGPPLLVIAGAGSGKTNTLAHRVAHAIISNGVSSLICQRKFSNLTDKCRRYGRRNFLVLNSQKKLRLTNQGQFRYLSESID